MTSEPSCRRHKLIFVTSGARGKDDSEIRDSERGDVMVSNQQRQRVEEIVVPLVTSNIQHIYFRQVKGAILKMCWAVTF